MKRLLASCFGLGRLPIAPGTWGSLPSVIIFAIMCQFRLPGHLITIVMASLIMAGSVICVKFAPAAIEATGKNDPGEVVADELAGQAVTYLVIPFFIPVTLTTSQICIITSAGFLLFRFFDIVKPWPIKKLEKLPKGYGILADDLLAGVFAAVILLIIIFLWLGG
ncbi:MAG: phosphatidylglycerophosphatase A [Sedimentisphaerales bacterium]|nr:phosphatidylglycerophosphatase A [Sedimentisphaerales bacterium]